jgi:hypothetical protein
LRRHQSALPVAIAALAAGVGWSSLSAKPQVLDEIDVLLVRVAERITATYRRAQSVVVLERSVVQPIGSNWGADGLSRTVESELRVEFNDGGDGSLPSATMVRDVRRINGRAPRERDQKDRSGCTDPVPLSPEPLAFLLPASREQYQFKLVGAGKVKDRGALVVEFKSSNRRSRPELIEDERGHDDCFDWKGPVATNGRVWVDGSTHDVLRVDRRVLGPVDVRVPWVLQRRYGFGLSIVIDRDDVSMRYQPVAFTDPDEVILLPESIETMTVVRGGLQSIRRSETYHDYRRFLTSGRVVRVP